jgi:CRP/FNR family transcriptional regulator, cyclic AMP receptor protein
VLNKEDIEFLSGLSMFAGLRREVVARIGATARRIDLVEDQILFREGELAKEMAVVLSGKLEVMKRTDTGTDACIAVLGPGDVVGEMSLIDIQPRSADVWARAPVSVVLLHHVALAELYREDTQSYTLLVLNIAREISIRLRRLDTVMANIMGHLQAVSSGPVPVRGNGVAAREGGEAARD